MSLHDIFRGDVMPQSGVSVSIGRNTFDPPAPVVPVFDIHARSLVMHDSGAPTNSGIIQYDSVNNRLQLIPGTSGAQPIVTAVYWDGYDNTGGLSVAGTNVTVAIDTERINSHSDVFVFSGNELQINMPGVYSFEFRVSIDGTTGTRSSANSWLERQVAGGAFATITGTNAYSYHRITNNGEDTASNKAIIVVAVGDKVRVRAVRLTGSTLLTIAEGSSLTVRKLA